MMGYGWGMGGVGMIFMLVFWVALIALVVWAVSGLLQSSRGPGAERRESAEAPQAILDRRFAAGEIDIEEYQRARDELAATHTRQRPTQ